MIAHLKLVIAKLRHDKFGASSERGRELLDQLELELGELIATVAEDAAQAESQAGARAAAPPPRKPSRGPLPAHLPRERVVLPSPSTCSCCGGKRSKLGEAVTETLEVVPGPITEAACWAHFRRKVFELAEVARAPLAAEAVQRIDRVFDAERAVNGCLATDRLAHRQRVVAPLVADLHVWMLETRGRLSRHNDLARALDYALKRWPAFTRFLDDGQICLTNNAAERALRGIALGRKAWLFAGSNRGGERAAALYSLITTAKLNDVDPRAWLADVLARSADHPASRLNELLPWNWHHNHTLATAAA
jgi:transposase